MWCIQREYYQCDIFNKLISQVLTLIPYQFTFLGTINVDLSGVNTRFISLTKILHKLSMTLGMETTMVNPNSYNFYMYLYR